MNAWRTFLAAWLLTAVALSAQSTPVDSTRQASDRQRPAETLPIVFAHGNGDSAALWQTIMWRFESNGYARRALVAVDFTEPAAPLNDTVAEPNRSSTADQASQLAAVVARTLLETGGGRVALVGSSRGGNTIRNFVRFGGGLSSTAVVVLCGTPNHGVFVSPQNLDSEWNGRGHFLTRLNAGGEVSDGPRWVTIRSDRQDKYAQPPSPAQGPLQGTGFDSPVLARATNIVVDGLDHREVAFHPRAFAVMYEAITGAAPRTTAIVPEDTPVLDGVISGFANGAPTNRPLAGAFVEVFEVDADTAQRRGPAVHEARTAADGRWGPFHASAKAYYEVVVTAPGYPVTHVYRTPFPRSSAVVHVRLGPAPSELPASGSAVVLTRPRGYLGVGRDVFTIDGREPPDVPAGVPSASTAFMTFAAQDDRPIRVRLNDETLTVRLFPLSRGHLVFAEFHH